jgi:hypothetical protein
MLNPTPASSFLDNEPFSLPLVPIVYEGRVLVSSLPSSYPWFMLEGYALSALPTTPVAHLGIQSYSDARHSIGEDSNSGLNHG